MNVDGKTLQTPWVHQANGLPISGYCVPDELHPDEYEIGIVFQLEDGSMAKRITHYRQTPQMANEVYGRMVDNFTNLMLPFVFGMGLIPVDGTDENT